MSTYNEAIARVGKALKDAAAKLQYMTFSSPEEYNNVLTEFVLADLATSGIFISDTEFQQRLTSLAQSGLGEGAFDVTEGNEPEPNPNVVESAPSVATMDEDGRMEMPLDLTTMKPIDRGDDVT